MTRDFMTADPCRSKTRLFQISKSKSLRMAYFQMKYCKYLYFRKMIVNFSRWTFTWYFFINNFQPRSYTLLFMAVYLTLLCITGTDYIMKWSLPPKYTFDTQIASKYSYKLWSYISSGRSGFWWPRMSLWSYTFWLMIVYFQQNDRQLIRIQHGSL